MQAINPGPQLAGQARRGPPKDASQDGEPEEEADAAGCEKAEAVAIGRDLTTAQVIPTLVFWNSGSKPRTRHPGWRRGIPDQEDWAGARVGYAMQPVRYFKVAINAKRNSCGTETCCASVAEKSSGNLRHAAAGSNCRSASQHQAFTPYEKLAILLYVSFESFNDPWSSPGRDAEYIVGDKGSWRLASRSRL